MCFWPSFLITAPCVFTEKAKENRCSAELLLFHKLSKNQLEESSYFAYTIWRNKNTGSEKGEKI